MNIIPVQFDDYDIRRVYDEKTETWYFSVVDIIRALLQQPDFQAARNYWKVLKNRLNKEGSETVTNCNRLKLPAEDGKMRLTDVASPEVLLRLIQSVPSPKAEPIKLWLAKVGYERMQDMADPARSLDRAREYWQQHGRSEKWIQQRLGHQQRHDHHGGGRISCQGHHHYRAAPGLRYSGTALREAFSGCLRPGAALCRPSCSSPTPSRASSGARSPCPCSSPSSSSH